MELFKFWRLAKHFLRDVELPRKTIWIPDNYINKKASERGTDVPRYLDWWWNPLAFKCHIAQTGDVDILDGRIEGVCCSKKR